MAGQENPLRVAAIARHKPTKDRKRFRAVFQKIGKANFGMNPVIGNPNDDALARQGFADDAIFAFPARLKCPAVKEQDNRGGRLERIGNVKVQPVARGSAIGNIAINMIAAERREKIEDRGGGTAWTEQTE